MTMLYMLRKIGIETRSLRSVSFQPSRNISLICKPHVVSRSLQRLNVLSKRTVKTPTMDWKPLKSHKTNLRLAEQQAKSPILRKFFLGLMIAMPVISFFLGCWQVKRLKWKVNLIANGENALLAPPLKDLPADLDPEAVKDFEYRRFKVKGRFDYDQEMFLGPRMRDGKLGYLLVTPFVRSSGGKPILVERGWIQKEKVVPETRNHGYLSYLAFPQGEIEIEALFRNMPQKSRFQYDHEFGDRLFHSIDIDAMARQSDSLPIYTQMIYDLSDHPEWKRSGDEGKFESIWNRLFKKNSNNEESTFSGTEFDPTLAFQEVEFVNQGVPIAPTPKVKFTNNHLQYLITWFGLSVCSSGLLIYSIWKMRRFSSAEKVIDAKRKEMNKHW